MRRFLAVKGCRELLERLQAAREGKRSEEALVAVAQAMRAYALQRPALSAAAFRTAAADCQAHDDLHAVMLDVLADCGLSGKAAEDALNMIRSLVRGYVLNEVMHALIGVDSYDDSFESALQVLVAGLPVLIAAPAVSTSR